MAQIKWRKWNRATHRDLGYFFVAMCIIYGLSGIAINHIGDWNPSYVYINKTIEIGHPIAPKLTKQEVKDLLEKVGEADSYKHHMMANEETLKVFLHGGSALIDINTGEGQIEKVMRRPIFHAVNFLHYNPKKWWVWFSDAFAIGMIVLAITGLFILKGKNGITRRGAVITIAGIIIPVIFLLLYY
ncbi:MAG: PepSY-associated TM helix domain-containing protein [Bacteroidales bacterium]|nr:PepSY-associated TM helix domain-containing protein [Bacteroidales bacterium]